MTRKITADKLTETNAGEDANAPSRKHDHIELALKSQISAATLDERFYYEPLLAAHPDNTLPPFHFLGKTLQVPLWVSSMTGGTRLAYTINQNLARACGEYGMGMGLGSCRSLLYSNDMFPDFDVRKVMGYDVPLFANLGIAQVEKMIAAGEVHKITAMVDKLEADGLIIHVNPLQEWLQPEGDRFTKPPLETITRFLELASLKVIVKEVGQGMGPGSLEALLRLPLEAVDFAANGGTNFAQVELLRSDTKKQLIYSDLAFVGHSADEMVQMTNRIVAQLGDQLRCRQVIISGGIKTFLDGYYLVEKLSLPSVYGQASGFLKHARESYEELQQYVEAQIQGLALAKAFLRIRN